MMGRSGSRSNRRRDASVSSHIANANALPPISKYDPIIDKLYGPLNKRTPYAILKELEDRRFWVPSQFALPASVHTKNTRLIVRPTIRRRFRFDPVGYFVRRPAINLVDRVGFRQPRRVLTCIRRAIRKEVLFAHRQAGRGGGSQRSPIWTAISKIRC